MRLDKDTTFLFHDIDRHGVQKNYPSGMLVNDFTLMMRIKPDLKEINKVIKRRRQNPDSHKHYSMPGTVYHKQCIFGKNGKHTGLFFATFLDEKQNLVHSIEYEWWQNPNWEINQNEEEDEMKAVKIFIERSPDRYFDIIVKKYDNKFSLTVDGVTESLEYNNVIDYSQSLMWLGAANRLLDDTEFYDEGFTCLFTGDVTLLHMQEAPLGDDNIKLFFKNYDDFKKLGFKTVEDVVYISTNFAEVTSFKVRDYSGNGLHPLVYSKEWIG